MVSKLVFDLGFHNGDDTDYYLKKGVKVVAVEANPNLYEKGLTRFKREIETGELVLLNKAIAEKQGEIDFFIHKIKDNWSSCYQSLAESDGSKSHCIKVQTVTMESLIQKFGKPYYLKVDVEGMDTEVARQLHSLKDKPDFVSFEISKSEYAGIFAWLHVAGYQGFQLINQQNIVNQKITPEVNSRESESIEYQFGEHSSGMYALDLDDSKWINYDELLTRYIKYKELKYLDNANLALGWIDVHARLS